MLDNASIHKTPRIHRWLVRHPLAPPHFTPNSASELNLGEYRFSVLMARQLKRGRSRLTPALESSVHAYIVENNAPLKSFAWISTVQPTKYFLRLPLSSNEFLTHTTRACCALSPKAQNVTALGSMSMAKTTKCSAAST
nr:hypothetical protein [Caldimonas tepidiphila]